MGGKSSDEVVVLVHGLFLTGWDMFLLRHRLSLAGYRVRQFSYQSTLTKPQESARKLESFIQDIDAEKVHFTAHSLGGLLMRYLFHDYPEQRPGRIITLGTPHHGSAVARYIAETLPGRLILGKSHDPLVGNPPPWRSDHELGVIAGTHDIGIGKLFPGLSGENDGTVSGEETRLANAKGHIVLPVSHTGMLFSREVASQTVHFLRYGYFSGTAESQDAPG